MASAKKTNVSKHECEIDKLRNENKWDKLRDYSTSLLKNKDSKYECLAKLCLGEADLERFLFFNPLFNDIESNNNYILENDLNNSKTYLNEVVQKFDKEKYSNEAQILLSKLHYSQKNYNDALNLLRNRIDLSTRFDVNGSNLRKIQLFAEAYALKGLCLEQAHSKNLNEIISCFQLSTDMAIAHSKVLTPRFSQQQTANGTQRTSSNDDEATDIINPLFEIALQKTPLLFVNMGDIVNGLKKFRELLLERHLQSVVSVRQSLLKKFSECLMNSICEANYFGPDGLIGKNEKLYIPRSLDEETLLCLLLSQYLACKDVMLLRQPRYRQIREYTFNNAISSFDLLSFYLTYRKSYLILLDKFESMMKFSFEQFPVWYQYGLTLLCAEKYQKAYLVLKECNRMKPDYLTCILLLAQLSVEHLFLVDEAIDWCKQALSLTNGKNTKAHILHGCACLKKYDMEKQHALKLVHLENGLSSFKEANHLDKYNYLPYYHMAHAYALLRRITESIECLNSALKYKNDDKDCLHLLTLLLTSTKNYDEAYTVISKACSLYEDFELLYTKARIEEYLFGLDECMSSFIKLILVYKKRVQSLDNIHYTFKNRQTGLSMETSTILGSSHDNSSATMANFQNSLKLNEAIGKTITMLLQNDQFPYKYTQNNQQNTTGSHNPSVNPLLSTANSKTIMYLLQLIRILSEICEFYLRHDCIKDAESCCMEICTLHPMSHLAMYLKGRIHQYKADYRNAKQCFMNALSINPYHIQSLEQLSIVLFDLGDYSLAEKMLRDAISINNSLPQLWSLLGLVLDAQDDNVSSMECYQTALQLESTNPILPFKSLTRIL